MFLNACESAVVSENKMSNLAKILIGTGIPRDTCNELQVYQQCCKDIHSELLQL